MHSLVGDSNVHYFVIQIVKRKRKLSLNISNKNLLNANTLVLSREH